MYDILQEREGNETVNEPRNVIKYIRQLEDHIIEQQPKLRGSKY